MISKNSSMYCERGKMLLTHTLYARFNARFIERVTEEPLLQRTQNPRGRFFCPACGQRMKFVGGYVQCPDGHGSINDSIFDLNSCARTIASTTEGFSHSDQKVRQLEVAGLFGSLTTSLAARGWLG